MLPWLPMLPLTYHLIPPYSYRNDKCRYIYKHMMGARTTLGINLNSECYKSLSEPIKQLDMLMIQFEWCPTIYGRVSMKIRCLWYDVTIDWPLCTNYIILMINFELRWIAKNHLLQIHNFTIVLVDLQLVFIFEYKLRTQMVSELIFYLLLLLCYCTTTKRLI